MGLPDVGGKEEQRQQVSAASEFGRGDEGWQRDPWGY